MIFNLFNPGMKVVSGPERGNQANIITLTHLDMTLDVAKH